MRVHPQRRRKPQNSRVQSKSPLSSCSNGIDLSSGSEFLSLLTGRTWHIQLKSGSKSSSNPTQVSPELGMPRNGPCSHFSARGRGRRQRERSPAEPHRQFTRADAALPFFHKRAGDRCSRCPLIAIRCRASSASDSSCPPSSRSTLSRLCFSCRRNPAAGAREHGVGFLGGEGSDPISFPKRRQPARRSDWPQCLACEAIDARPMSGLRLPHTVEPIFQPVIPEGAMRAAGEQRSEPGSCEVHPGLASQGPG